MAYPCVQDFWGFLSLDYSGLFQTNLIYPIVQDFLENTDNTCYLRVSLQIRGTYPRLRVSRGYVTRIRGDDQG
jgi:hypothetical protein